MNVRTIEVKVDRLGRRYPPDYRLPESERNRARALVHNLICRDHLSFRQAQLVMYETYALRRSLGSLHRDLTAYECPVCAP